MSGRKQPPLCELYDFYLEGVKQLTDTFEGFQARTSTQWKVDDVVVSDSWIPTNRPIKRMSLKSWMKTYARWGWTCELAAPSDHRVRSSEIVVGMTLGVEGELLISYYHPATSQELTILANHFGSPLVLQEEAATTFVVKIRHPERIEGSDGRGQVAPIYQGIALGNNPSRELDFDDPSKGVWPIGESRVWLDRYISRVGQADYFRR